MPMHILDVAVEIIAQEINNYLLVPTGSEIVIPANLLTQSGALSNGLDNRIAMSVVNIEEDRLSRPLDIHRKLANGMVEVVKPEVRLNLYLLFTAVAPQGTNVGDGGPFTTILESLSRVIGFFQTKNFFDHQNTPSLSPNIEKIWMELYPMTFEQQNHLWGSLGAKYMPSIMYKARLVRIQEEEITSDGPAITQLTINGQDKTL